MSHEHDSVGTFLRMWNEIGKLLAALHEHDKASFHEACKGVLTNANFCGFCGEPLA